MPFSQKLLTDLVSDIEEIFPATREGEPSSQLFILQDPRAPIVTISRDPRTGSIIVPHFFFATENPEHLLQISSIISSSHPELMPLTHNVIGTRTGGFTVVPFLYDRNPASSAFVATARECGEALLTSNLTCAYTIIDCSLTIVSQGNLSRSNDYEEVFDHLVNE